MRSSDQRKVRGVHVSEYFRVDGNGWCDNSLAAPDILSLKKHEMVFVTTRQNQSPT